MVLSIEQIEEELTVHDVAWAVEKLKAGYLVRVTDASFPDAAWQEFKNRRVTRVSGPNDIQGLKLKEWALTRFKGSRWEAILPLNKATQTP